MTVSQIRQHLQREGFEMTHCRAVSQAKSLLARSSRFRLALVDIMLGPEDNGLDFVRFASVQCPRMGIMVISGRNQVNDRILGLQMGADDYLTKPFDGRELVVRARRLIQRLDTGGTAERKALFRFSGFTLDKTRRLLLWQDQDTVPLTGREMDLLICLVEGDNHVVNREILANLVCGRRWHAGDRSVDVMVSCLRRKLKAHNPGEALIKSIRGVGYCFGARVEREG